MTFIWWVSEGCLMGAVLVPGGFLESAWKVS